MKCEKCGFEAINDFDFCPQCGEQAKKAEQFVNVAHNKVLPMVKDVLFLVMCILLSVATVLEFANGQGIPVLTTLITIFSWLTYAKGTKNIADANHLKGISGTVYAGYVINNVAFIIFIVCGLIMSAVLLAFSTSAEFIATLTEELLNGTPDIDATLAGIIATYSWAIGIVFLIIGGVGLAINLCGMRKIHLFVKSVYQGIILQTPIFAHVRAARNWLIVFAVGYGLDIFSKNITAAVIGGCYTAILILAVILINKHLLKPEQIEE